MSSRYNQNNDFIDNPSEQDASSMASSFIYDDDTSSAAYSYQTENLPGVTGVNYNQTRLFHDDDQSASSSILDPPSLSFSLNAATIQDDSTVKYSHTGNNSVMLDSFQDHSLFTVLPPSSTAQSDQARSYGNQQLLPTSFLSDSDPRDTPPPLNNKKAKIRGLFLPSWLANAPPLLKLVIFASTALLIGSIALVVVSTQRNRSEGNTPSGGSSSGTINYYPLTPSPVSPTPPTATPPTSPSGTGVGGDPPSNFPTKGPLIKSPTLSPSSTPSERPSSPKPSSQPTSQPSKVISHAPSKTQSELPSQSPSNPPSSNQPSNSPSSNKPSLRPSNQPSVTKITSSPSSAPSLVPSSVPSPKPSKSPSSKPSSSPTQDVSSISFAISKKVDNIENLLPTLPIDKDSNNQHTNFLVHLGDFINFNDDDCSENEFIKISNQYSKSPIPVFFLPGNNEWVRCSDPAKGGELWKTYFIDYEKKWNFPWQVKRQTIRPENFSFVYNRILYMGLNVFGGTIQPFDVDERFSDNLNWAKDNVNQHNDEIEVVFIFANAGPTPTNVPFFTELTVLVNDWVEMYDLRVVYMKQGNYGFSVNDNALDTPFFWMINTEAGTWPPTKSWIDTQTGHFEFNADGNF